MDNAMDGKDTVNIAPKKANWDLKRDGADKLATLYRLTTISIVQVSVMIYLSSQTDISLSQTDISLSQSHTSLSQSHTSLSQSHTSLSQSLSESHLFLSESHLSLSLRVTRLSLSQSQTPDTPSQLLFVCSVVSSPTHLPYHKLGLFARQFNRSFCFLNFRCLLLCYCCRC